MIRLSDDALNFAFPEVHPDANFSIDFQRTLRIPDDDAVHSLPPGLGAFPLRRIDDGALRVPAEWRQRGGVALPMYQSEALWLDFTSSFSGGSHSYPFAIKVATGGVNALTGAPWNRGLHQPEQDYLVSPGQPWLDGYCVAKGVIRQFVAMPLGSGYGAEEQLKSNADLGGLQILAIPMKGETYEKLRLERGSRFADDRIVCCSKPAMSLAPGGRMRQEVYKDPYGLDVWDTRSSSRCFVHVCNSLVWEAIAAEAPPTPPPTAASYTRAGLPWFDYYSDAGALSGAQKLAALKSIRELATDRPDEPLPENEPIDASEVVEVGPRRRGNVLEGSW